VPRSPRLQVAGGIYHITSRGNRRQLVFADAEDHLRFLWFLDALARRRGWLGYGYCLMPNHYHLVLETPKADLSAGMHWLNFRYAQAFNHRHALDGHHSKTGSIPYKSKGTGTCSSCRGTWR
jgi:putative transposase